MVWCWSLPLCPFNAGTIYSVKCIRGILLRVHSFPLQVSRAPVAIVAALGLVWRRRYPGAPVVGSLLGAYRYCRWIGGIIDALVIPSYRHPVCYLGVVSGV